MQLARIFEIADASWQCGVCGIRGKPVDPVLTQLLPGVPSSERKFGAAPPSQRDGCAATPRPTPVLSVPAAAAVPVLSVPPTSTLAAVGRTRAQEPAFVSLRGERASFNAEDDVAFGHEMAKCRDRLAEVFHQERTAITQTRPETTDLSLKAVRDEATVASLERTMTGLSSAKGSPALSSTHAGSSSPASTRVASRTVSALEIPDLPPEFHGAPARTLRPVVGLTLGEQFGEPGAAPSLPSESAQNGSSSRRAPTLMPPTGALQAPAGDLHSVAGVSSEDKAEIPSVNELCGAPTVEEETLDVNELYERANVGERIRQLRQRLIAGGETAPEPGSQWCAAEKDWVVMRQKLECVAAAEARSKALQPCPASRSAGCSTTTSTAKTLGSSTRCPESGISGA